MSQLLELFNKTHTQEDVFTIYRKEIKNLPKSGSKFKSLTETKNKLVRTIVENQIATNGWFKINALVSKESTRKLLTGVPFKKWFAKKNNSKVLGLPDEPEVKLCDTELYFSLGFYAKNGTLNLRTVPDTDLKTRRKYFVITGDSPTGMTNYVLDNTPSTWANKLWFEVKNLTPELKERLFVPDNTEGQTWSGDIFYNNNWIWNLIMDFGFRIGQQDVDLIKSHIYSPENIEDFMEGYNYMDGR